MQLSGYLFFANSTLGWIDPHARTYNQCFKAKLDDAAATDLGLVSCEAIGRLDDLSTDDQYASGADIAWSNRLYYEDGRTLFDGSNFFFQNGRHATWSGRSYYSNGSEAFYTVSTTYRPDGRYLSYGSNLYYASGSTFT